MITAAEARRLADGNFTIPECLNIINNKITEATNQYKYSTTLLEEPFNVWASRNDIANTNPVANTVLSTLTANGYHFEFSKSPRSLTITWET